MDSPLQGAVERNANAHTHFKCVCAFSQAVRCYREETGDRLDGGWSRVRKLRGFDVIRQSCARTLCQSGQLSRYEQGRSEIGAEVTSPACT